MNHLIHRQLLELDLSEQRNALTLQDRASQMFQEKVIPALETVFDAIAPGNRVVRLDRLEIDLGNLPEKSWETAFFNACMEQIGKAIQSALTDQGVSQASEWDQEENTWEIFLYFLQAGHLPWFASAVSLEQLGHSAILYALDHPQRIQGQLKNILKNNDRAVHRLMLQFSDEFARIMVASASGARPEWMVKAEEKLKAYQQRGKSNNLLLLWYQFLLKSDGAGSASGLAANGGPEETVNHFLKSVFTRFSENQPADAMFRNGDARQPSPPENPDGKRDALEAGAPKVWGRQPEPEEGIAAPLAGLVLFAPYLSSFFAFAGLGLTLENPRHSPDLERAIHLLHYLATGEEQPEEPAIPLAKLLCGLPMDEPVSRFLVLTDKEKAEADDLVHALIRNWTALKNTGVEAFRRAFVQRNGLLRWQDNAMGAAWVLAVERQGQDVLLDRLPWGYSVIKLPWMPIMLRVEW